MIEVKKVTAILPKSWKKSFNSRVVLPAKMRFCNEYNRNLICNRCNNQVKENKNIKLF